MASTSAFIAATVKTPTNRCSMAGPLPLSCRITTIFG
ncbi:Uncharacterised protein [Mycobacteroides abscessus subsp. abscessus]|nr:Uncharacterised protein [Mycobacteroides abscessus subsp. abscessus]